MILLGDLDDAIFEELARALPPGVARIHLEPGRFPDALPRAVLQADQVILHLTSLGERELAALQAIHAAGSARISLIVGPHIRAAMLERARPLVHAILPEAAAPYSLRRLLAQPARQYPDLNGLKVFVAAAEFAIRGWLDELLAQWRCRVLDAARLDSVPEGTQAIVWVLPALETGWEAHLARAAAGYPLIALIPFADRLLVDRILGLGATACLDLNGDPADLADLLQPIAAAIPAPEHRSADAPHALPPAPHLSGVPGAAKRPVARPESAQ
jgi:hypothetical protein